MNANYYIGTYMCFYASNPPSYPKQLCGKCNHFEKCFDFLFKKKDMKTKEIKIEAPEGYEVDKEHSTFEKIVFKKKDELPKTWNEYLMLYRHSDFYITLETVLPIKLEYKSAFETLAKLIELRDYYNDGWKPDWDGITLYNGIFRCNQNSFAIGRASRPIVLYFKSSELRDLFYNNFENLIEQAKELL